MKIKVLAAVVLLISVFLGAYIFFDKRIDLNSIAKESPRPTGVQITKNIPYHNNLSQGCEKTALSTSKAATIAPTVLGSGHEDSVNERVAELMDLGMKDDQESFKIISSELTNPEKEIRMGAASALMQFGDASVVPYLRELAARTTDPKERASYDQAADLLALPPFSELHSH